MAAEAAAAKRQARRLRRGRHARRARAVGWRARESRGQARENSAVRATAKSSSTSGHASRANVPGGPSPSRAIPVNARLVMSECAGKAAVKAATARRSGGASEVLAEPLAMAAHVWRQDRMVGCIDDGDGGDGAGDGKGDCNEGWMRTPTSPWVASTRADGGIGGALPPTSIPMPPAAVLP